MNESEYWSIYIPKYNVLIPVGDMNASIGKGENDKFCLHNSPNRNGEYLAVFSQNWFAYLNTKFQKNYRI